MRLCVLVRFLNKETIEAVFTLQTFSDGEAVSTLALPSLISHPHRSCLSAGFLWTVPFQGPVFRKPAELPPPLVSASVSAPGLPR